MAALTKKNTGCGERPAPGSPFTIRAVSAPGQVVASAGEGGAIRLTRREPNSLPGSPPAPPGCTSYPEPPSCSACSGRLVPHQSPGLKHSLTRTSPRTSQTDTDSLVRTPLKRLEHVLMATCAPGGRGGAPWRRARRGRGRLPQITKQRVRLSSTACCACASAIDLMCARTARSLARLRLTHTGSQARPSGPHVPVARGVMCV